MLQEQHKKKLAAQQQRALSRATGPIKPPPHLDYKLSYSTSPRTPMSQNGGTAGSQSPGASNQGNPAGAQFEPGSARSGSATPQSSARLPTDRSGSPAGPSLQRAGSDGSTQLSSQPPNSPPANARGSLRDFQNGRQLARGRSDEPSSRSPPGSDVEPQENAQHPVPAPVMLGQLGKSLSRKASCTSMCLVHFCVLDAVL